jgi:ATP-binding cassette, subfamily B (MDR/TAP), member 1
MASSLTFGMLVQYATTCLVCLALALSRSWSLTLVILSAVPLLMAIQAFSQAFAGPLLAAERAQIATAGTLVDRAVVAIATVKAFNAVPHELSALNPILDSIRGAARKLNAAWGFTSCLSQFVMMTMFVQGFWFGAKLVRDGKISAGDVMSVFWACLIATSNMQMCIPQLITLTKGKFAAVSLLGLIDGTHLASPSPTITNQSSVTILSPHKHRRPMYLRKIVPPRCTGEFTLHNVTFAYPSRPTVPVLTHVSIYLPANETTFIVGGSGSGKSTLAQLLLRMYNPQDGTIQLDDQDVAYLDEAWMRQHVAGISQNCILFDMSVHDNVALGLANSVTGRRPEDATRKEVIEACRMALLHDFVRDLPDGYDTKLGNGGANLSGGQKQRLAIARARLRNPTVLILGMSLPSPTSLPSFP